jgi:hypothetical protein
MERKGMIRSGFEKGILKVVATALIVAGSCGVAQAQTGGGFDLFDLSWNTIASGTISTGGPYKLGGVKGQAATGPMLSGGSFTLQPGFLQDSSYFSLPVILSHFALD